eukprot:Amastigsp_a773_342.p4 type:complete len:108 gc:universal Amastigsp_a773_342:805-482(-)
MTSCTGFVWALGFTKSVAPISRAMSNLVSLMSTAMMREAPAMRAPWMALRPTPPRPNTATVAPASTLAVFHTAPSPVVMPHPKRQIFSIGASGCGTTHTAISGTTVY